MTPVDYAWGIARALVESALLALVVILVTRTVSSLTATTRAALWWIVCARLALGFVPALPLALPFTAPDVAPVHAARERLGAFVADGVALPAVGTPASAATLTGPSPQAVALFALLLVWVAGAVFSAVRLVRDKLRLDALWRAAEPFDPERLSAWAWGWLPAPGWTAVPSVRVSSATTVPLTLGWLRPRILLPADCGALPDEELRLALAHEFVHVRRHDLLFGWVPALAQVLFWVNPVALWSAREYGQAREEACDAEALRLTGAAPREYGDLLLRFGVAPSVPSTAAALAGSRTRRALTRRLLMLERTARPSALVRAIGAALLLVAGLAALPVRFVSPNAVAHEQPGTPAKLGDAIPADLKIEAFAYVFTRKGESGTYGSGNVGDLEFANEVKKQYDEDLWIVRLGNEWWLVRDREVRQRAWDVLAAEREESRNQRPLQSQMSDIDRQTQRLESHRLDLEQRRDELEDARDRLERELQDARADEARVKEARAELERLSAEAEKLMSEGAELARVRDELRSKWEPLYQQSMAAYEARERRRPAMLRQLKSIAQEAVATQRAERLN